MEKVITRKNIRLKDFDYSSPGAYFVTICTDKRKNLFWKDSYDVHKIHWISVGANCVRPKNLPLSPMGESVMRELERWNKTYSSVSLYSYIIMPDHLHILVVISADEHGRPQVAPTLDRMVKQFKGTVTKTIGSPIWQKSFVEHVIRNKNEFGEIMNYIRENPIRLYYGELRKKANNKFCVHEFENF